MVDRLRVTETATDDNQSFEGNLDGDVDVPPYRILGQDF